MQEKTQENKRRILVADTSALISLEIGSILKDSLDEFEYVIPNIVFKEIEQISEIEDDHGMAAQKVLERIKENNIRRSSVKDVGKVQRMVGAYRRIDMGEAEALIIAQENDHDILITDDLRSLKDLKDLSESVRIHLSVYVIASMVLSGSLKRKDALEVLSKISNGRSWENSAIYDKAKDYIEYLKE